MPRAELLLAILPDLDQVVRLELRMAPDCRLYGYTGTRYIRLDEGFPRGLVVHAYMSACMSMVEREVKVRERHAGP